MHEKGRQKQAQAQATSLSKTNSHEETKRALAVNHVNTTADGKLELPVIHLKKSAQDDYNGMLKMQQQVRNFRDARNEKALAHVSFESVRNAEPGGSRSQVRLERPGRERLLGSQKLDPYGNREEALLRNPILCPVSDPLSNPYI